MEIDKVFKEWIIKRILEKINNFYSSLSYYGFPNEAYSIRIILGKIRNNI